MKLKGPFCWHCGKALSNMNNPTGNYWFAEVTIEPGRKVKVHKICASAAMDSVRRLTANVRVPLEDQHDDSH